MANELKPCPFCGGKGVLQNYVKFNPYANTSRPCCKIICTQCFCTMGEFESEDTTLAYLEHAATMWNERADNG